MKQAKLYWLIPFDPFDYDSVKRVRLIDDICHFIIALLLVYFVISILFPLIPYEGKMDLFVQLFVLWYLLVVMFVIVRIFPSVDWFLNNVNADQNLHNFDLEKDRLKLLSKQDIEENGYFSAYGYWQLYFATKSMEHEEETEKQKKAIHSKYPDVYTTRN